METIFLHLPPRVLAVLVPVVGVSLALPRADNVHVFIHISRQSAAERQQNGIRLQAMSYPLWFRHACLEPKGQYYIIDC
jgi:hypothetical protein